MRDSKVPNNCQATHVIDDISIELEVLRKEALDGLQVTPNLINLLPKLRGAPWRSRRHWLGSLLVCPRRLHYITKLVLLDAALSASTVLNHHPRLAVGKAVLLVN